MFTLNAADEKVTHADLAGVPLCGFMADGDDLTRVPAKVTCDDCKAAQES